MQQVVSIANDSSEEKTYRIDFSQVGFNGSADDLLFQELDANHAAWLRLEPSEVTIGPGAEAMIEVSITPSESAKGEVFSFAVIATEVVEEQPGVAIARGLASIFFVEIGDSGINQLHIDSFETVPSNVHRPPVRFATLIRNDGTGLSQPQIGVAVKNIWGKEVAIVPLNPTGRRLPGGTNRVFTGDWEAEGFRFGPYTAELYVFPDSSPTTLTASTNVVLFPGRMFVIFLVIAVVFIGTFYVILRKRRSRM